MSSLPTFPVLMEGQHRGEFIVSEARGFRSRDIATISNTGTAVVIYPAGLVMSIGTQESPPTPAVLAPYTSTSGTAAIPCILYDDVLVNPGLTSKVTILSHAAEVNGLELKYDPSITTAAQQATAIVALAGVGLIVR